MTRTQQIRAAYVEERRSWEFTHTGVRSDYGARAIARYDGGVDPGGRRYTSSSWVKIAAFADHHGVDPVRLVRASFMNVERPPEPTMIYSPAVFERSMKMLDGGRDRARIELMSQSAQFSAVADRRESEGATKAEAAECALGDPTAELSPLFRYCMAHAGGADGLVVRFRGPALLQYVRARVDYDDTWARVIPDQLRTAADKLAARTQPEA